MKTAMKIVVALALMTFLGCQMSPRGGSMMRDEGFRIAVPTFSTQVKQGELQTITVSLKRDSNFKQDVKLQIKTSKGITVEPASVTIRRAKSRICNSRLERPRTRLSASTLLLLHGIPETGEPTSVGFTVDVVAP